MQHVFRSWNLSQLANLKAVLGKAGKPSGFAMLDSNGRLPHNLLEAGYDKYSAYELAWQSLHMAAAAACQDCLPQLWRRAFYLREEGQSNEEWNDRGRVLQLRL